MNGRLNGGRGVVDEDKRTSGVSERLVVGRRSKKAKCCGKWQGGVEKDGRTGGDWRRTAGWMETLPSLLLLALSFLLDQDSGHDIFNWIERISTMGFQHLPLLLL